MIVAPYAGPGGWTNGLAALGLDDIGLELDAHACSTRAAAGHTTIRADVEHYPPERFAGAEGAIFSPPCTDYSTAGLKAGRGGATGRLIDTVPAWVAAIRPRWVLCEQVPAALGVWREHAAGYRRAGYSVWSGLLNCADYGVPQTRVRAFLIARRDGQAATPPAPTHTEGGASTFLGELAPWVTISDALGWDADVLMGFPRTDDGRPGGALGPYRRRDFRRGDQPAATITGRSRDVIVLNRRADYVDGAPTIRLVDCHTEPAPTITGTAGAGGVWTFDNLTEGTSRPITLAEVLTLQTFPPDYPLQGSRRKRFEQVGNAVPPRMATHLLATVTGRTIEAAA